MTLDKYSRHMGEGRPTQSLAKNAWKGFLRSLRRQRVQNGFPKENRHRNLVEVGRLVFLCYTITSAEIRFIIPRFI